MAKRFFFVAAGVLMLALAYHLGASTASAQAPGNPVVGIAGDGNGAYAATANGDVYLYELGGPASWRFGGNVFAGSTPVTSQSWGSLKAKYR